MIKILSKLTKKYCSASASEMQIEKQYFLSSDLAHSFSFNVSITPISNAQQGQPYKFQIIDKIRNS